MKEKNIVLATVYTVLNLKRSFSFLSLIIKKMSEESKFYKACRNGNLKQVKNLLQTLSLNEIDRVEPNGSTALHASCHYGHLDIVRALLERGVSRRPLNKNNRTPEDEAFNNEQIKALFRRSSSGMKDRFVSKTPDLQWMITGPEGFGTACDNIYLSKNFENLKEAHREINNAKELQNIGGMNQIHHLLSKAEQTNMISHI